MKSGIGLEGSLDCYRDQICMTGGKNVTYPEAAMLVYRKQCLPERAGLVVDIAFST